MKKLIILPLAFVALAAGKPEKIYTSYNAEINGLYCPQETNIRISEGEIKIIGQYNYVFYYTGSQVWQGYTYYNVNGGYVEIHHKKVFVRVGSVYNVYFY